MMRSLPGKTVDIYGTALNKKISDKDLGIGQAKISELRVDLKRPRVGVVCVRGIPSWSLFIGQVGSLLWILSTNPAIYTTSKSVSIMKLDVNALGEKLRYTPVDILLFDYIWSVLDAVLKLDVRNNLRCVLWCLEPRKRSVLKLTSND